MPPLPNIKKKDDTQINKKNLQENKEKLEKKEKDLIEQPNKSFKKDTSFLKND